MAFNFSALQDSLAGAASTGVFGEDAQRFSSVFGGNTAAISARPLQLQTVPQTVNPAANGPGAAVTNTSAPSAPFMAGFSGLGVSPTVIIAGLVLVVLAAVALKK